MGAERGVVKHGWRDCDVPRGDRWADVVALKERRERLSFHTRKTDREGIAIEEKKHKRAAVHVGNSSHI